MAAQPKLCVLSLKTAGLLVSVSVNDVRIYVNHTGSQETAAEKINPLLSPGPNGLAVSLGLPPLAGRHDHHDPPIKTASPSFSLLIQEGQQGVDPGQTGILVKYEWNQATAQLPRTNPRTVFEQTFPVADLPWTGPVWARVPALRPDPAAISALLKDYAAALRSKNIDRVVEFNALKFRELARSLALDEGIAIDAFRETLTDSSNAPDWSVTVSPSSQLTVEGNSHLVRVNGENDTAPIYATSNGERHPFDLTVTFQDGHWLIVH